MRAILENIMEYFPDTREKIHYSKIIFSKCAANRKLVDETNDKFQALKTTFQDIDRNDFIVNGVQISSTAISVFKIIITNEKIYKSLEECYEELLQEYKDVYKKEELKRQIEFFYGIGCITRDKLSNGNEVNLSETSNLSATLRACFQGMFAYVGNFVFDNIIDELILNCNQYFYQSFLIQAIVAENDIILCDPQYKCIEFDNGDDDLDITIKMVNSSVLQIGEHYDRAAMKEKDGEILISSSLSFQLFAHNEGIYYSDGKAETEFFIKESSNFLDRTLSWLIQIIDVILEFCGFETIDKKRRNKRTKVYIFTDKEKEIDGKTTDSEEKSMQKDEGLTEKGGKKELEEISIRELQGKDIDIGK